jgi:AcrR family transcriptional regulator
MARHPAPDTRDRVLDTAARLFYAKGVRAVGLQEIIDQAGVGKSSVYREFASKDELVVAWLNRSRRGWWQMTEAATAPYDGDPARQLLAIVEAVRDEIETAGFRGCRFLNTAAEFPDPDHPGNREAAEHLEEIHQQLTTLADGAGADDPDALASELLLVIDGMYANASVLGQSGPARRGIALAEELIARRTSGRTDTSPRESISRAGD